MESVRRSSPCGLLSGAVRKSVLGLEELWLDSSRSPLVLTASFDSALAFVLPGRTAAALRLGVSGIGFLMVLFLMAVVN